MSKRQHRPLLAPEEELIEAVDIGIQCYIGDSVCGFITNRKSRIREAHLVPHWKDSFQKKALEGGDQVRKAVKSWLFNGEFQGVEVLEVDTLCELVRKRVGTLHLIPEKTRQAKLKKGLDAHGRAILKPWTDSLRLRTDLRPELEEITGRINAARLETFKCPSEFRDTVILTLGTFFLMEPYDLTSHENEEAVIRFLSELIEEIEALTSQEITTRTSLDRLLVSISVWMHRGGGRALLESLSYTIDDVGRAFSAFIDSDIKRKDSLYELNKIISDSFAEEDLSLSVPDEGDLDIEEEEVETDEENVNLEACVSVEVESDIVSVDVLTDSTEDDHMSETSTIVEGAIDLSAPQHIKDLRALRYPADDNKSALVLDHILSTSFASVSFTRGFFRAVLSQIDLVLKHPSNYSVSQVRVLIEVMERLFESYKISSNEKLNLKGSSTEFTESLVMGILSKVQEFGSRHPGMKQAQIQVDLLKEELEKIELLKGLITAAEADPKSQAEISRRLFDVLTAERDQLPDTTDLESSIREYEPRVEACHRSLIDMRSYHEQLEEDLKERKAKLLSLVNKGNFDAIDAVNTEAREIKNKIGDLSVEIDLREKLSEEMSERLKNLKEKFAGSDGRAEALTEQINAADLQILSCEEMLANLSALNVELVKREEVLMTALEQVDLQMAVINRLLLAAMEGTIDFGGMEQKINQT